MVNKGTGTFLTIIVLLCALIHRTAGGSWKNLERKFIQERTRNRHWDENRIFFPEPEDSPDSNWRPRLTPQDEDARQGQCLDLCPTSREFSPVCGTNGVTYNNMGMLQCAIRCGEGKQEITLAECGSASHAFENKTCRQDCKFAYVHLHRSKPCSNNDRPLTTIRPTTSRPTTTPPSATSNSWDVQVDCMRSCPSTPEYNPVCGTNRVTYNNIGKLECAKICGVGVSLWRQAPCRTPVVSSTTMPTTKQALNFVTVQCISRCPAATQYSPVCGTDNQTYSNIGKLECAKYCGADVNQMYPWACSYTPNIAEQPNFEKFGPPTDVDYGEYDSRFPGPENQRRFWK